MTSTSTYSDQVEPRPEPSNENDDLFINTGPVELRDLPAGIAPALTEATWHGTKQPDDTFITIYHREALAQVQGHAVSQPRTEVGGVLLGHVYRQDTAMIVDMKAALPAYTADHGPYHFTFTADAWAQVHQDRAIHYPDLDIVGWFHTHPDLGVFYSADDVIVHTAAFTMPWHVGLVVDPINNEVAQFGWQDGEVVPLPGFYELTPAGNSSIVPWQSVRTAVWHDTYEQHLAIQTSRHSKRISIAGISIPTDALPLLFGSLAVLVAFLLMVGMLFISNSRINQLEFLANNLYSAQLEDATAAGLAECPAETVRILDPFPGQVIQTNGDVAIYGNVREPQVTRYLLQISNTETGAQVSTWEIRRGLATNTRLLARWDTTELPAGSYHLELVGLDGDGQPLDNDNTRCFLAITLER